MTRHTSVDVYRQIEAQGLLSKRRMQVYRILFNYGPLTATQIILKFKEQRHVAETGGITTRLSELRDRGVVEELGEVACPVTGRNVILWDVTAHLPKSFKKKEKPNFKTILKAVWRAHPETRELIREKLGEYQQ